LKHFSTAFACALLCLPLARPAVAQQLNGAAYVFRPGDAMELQVWPESAVNGRYPVDAEGQVHLPVIGAVDVGGRAIPTVREQLRERFAAALLKDPIVNVRAIFHVTVMGAVARPGQLEVDPSATLTDVVGLAGGFREEARADRVRIVRQGRTVLETSLAPGDEVNPATDLTFQSGDWVVVPERRFRLEPRDFLYVLQSVAIIVTLLK